MKSTSQTGLLSTEIKPRKSRTNVKFDFQATAVAAPFVTKPYAGLYNPYPEGCSILCNHPAIPEVRQILQKAKDNMGQDGKTMILPGDAARIRAELEQFQLKIKEREAHNFGKNCNHILQQSVISDIVPEALFRKYTETDSRPLTPAPTLASAQTRASATRRCVTPDPIKTSEIKEKTLLILDLRRSHSQETFSCYAGSTHINETPLIRIMNVELTPSSSRRSLLIERKQYNANSINYNKVAPKRTNKPDGHNRLKLPPDDINVVDHKGTMLEQPNTDDDDEDKEYIKRRGRKRKKRRASSSVSIFRTTTDPETLVAGVGTESKNPSARPSLASLHIDEIQSISRAKLDGFHLNVDSFLDYESIRELRRELTREMVDMEFDERRKIALEEVLKTVPRIKIDCEELKRLQHDTVLSQVNTELRFSLPRKFSRANIRFELPMDGRTLTNMSPMKYIREYVCLTSPRKLLYCNIFNIHRIRIEIDDFGRNEETLIKNGNTNESLPANEGHLSNNETVIKEISGNEIIAALGTLMGKKFHSKQSEEFQGLVGWSIEESYNFHTFSSICALCERLLAAEFYPNLPDRIKDPCQAIEIVDFEVLERKLKGRSMDFRLTKILNLIKVV